MTAVNEIAALVADAPPGEIDAVSQDIEQFFGKGAAVSRELSKELAQANVAQFRVVEVDGKLTVLSKYNQLDNETFFTHGTKPKKFTVKHETRATKTEGDYEPFGSEAAALQKAVDTYIAEHYPSEAVGAVFPTKDEGLAVIIVGRRLNPQNFHNGQITAEYIVSSDDDSIKGTIKADVHYFEEGNVRLKSSAPVNSKISSSPVAAIEKAENDFETGLNKQLVSLNEKEFKALRRQLPVTRQPMVWGKAVAGYKLGRELENR